MHVIVIGAGIVGASTAYHLTLRGVETTLIDRGDAGQATAAGAGIVAPWAARGDPAWQALADGAAQYYPHLISALAADGATDTGYAPVGGLALAPTSADAEAAASWLRPLRADGDPGAIGDITPLAPGEPARRFPPLREDWAACHAQGAARVDGRALRDALLHCAEARGLRRRSGGAELAVRAGRCTGALLDTRPLGADAVVLAAGCWASQLAEPHGHTLAVHPQRGQLLHLRLPGADTAHWPTVRAPDGEFYLLAFPPDRVVAGSTREDGAGFDHRSTAQGVRWLLDSALRIAPGLAGAALAETRVGLRPATPRGLPLIGAIPGLPGAVAATGFGAVGLTYGPYAGRLVAEMLTGAEPSIDLAALAPPADPDHPT